MKYHSTNPISGFIPILLLCLCITACRNDEIPTKPKVGSDENRNQYSLLISETTFDGITIGDLIDHHSNRLELDTLKNGEGEFIIYQIKNSSQKPYAYCLPNEHKTIGQIVVLTPTAKTSKGIHVGSTLEDLIAAHPNKLGIHGSEVEGRTHADHGSHLLYRLDVANFSYVVDFDKMDRKAKVMEIIIDGRSK